jgi:hypothetical protein
VTNRGLTGRAPSPEERKKTTRVQAREARLNKPPTWRGAVNRAVLAAGFMFIFLLLTSKGNVFAAVVFAIFAFALYVPSGFYLESFLFRRRQRKRQGS